MKILTALLFLLFFLPAPVFAQSKAFVRFEQDLNKLSAIMEELKVRKGIDGQKTLVAFGIPQNPIESADYWITYAAEALAFQKAQKYTSLNDVRYSLQTLAGKILKAKTQVRKALNE